MRKRAQQKRAAKHAKQAKQRTAAASRNAAPFTAVAANLPRLTSMDDILFGPLATPWGDFADTYATVADALAAAEEAGGVLSCFSFDDSGEYERSLRHGADGWTYEVALYPRGTLRELAKTSWLDADDQDQAVEQLTAPSPRTCPRTCATPDFRPCSGPRTRACRASAGRRACRWPGCRRGRMCAWRRRTCLCSPWRRSPTAPAAHTGRCPRRPSPCSARGLSARDCAGCGAPVTDRHPHWPGVLVSVENEYGPVCDRSRLEGESVQRVGHLLDAAQARPAGKLTGKEQKVRCQHCAVHVTEQHPDWPGVWTEAGGYSRPICAVVGSGCSDDLSYDLVDCVYPHVPVGADEGPAAAAVTAAKKGGYFFQPRLPSFLEG